MPPTGWQPDPALVKFLYAGLAPAYVGFGSMRQRAASLGETIHTEDGIGCAVASINNQLSNK